jgi:hypothetical protein
MHFIKSIKILIKLSIHITTHQLTLTSVDNLLSISFLSNFHYQLNMQAGIKIMSIAIVLP